MGIDVGGPMAVVGWAAVSYEPGTPVDRVSGIGCTVWGAGCRVGVGCGVEGEGCRDQGVGC